MVSGDFNLFRKNGVNGNSNNSSFSLSGQSSFTNSVWTGNTPVQRKSGNLVYSEEYLRIKQQAQKTAQNKVKNALARAKGEVKKA